MLVRKIIKQKNDHNGHWSGRQDIPYNFVACSKLTFLRALLVIEPTAAAGRFESF